MTSNLSRNAMAHILFTAALAAFITTPAFAGDITKSKGNGAYIAISGQDASGCIWSYLYVSRGGTTAAPETWMSYDVYNSCSGEWIAYGGGNVANASFKVTRQGATLVMSPTSSAKFSTYGVTGPIQLTLAADGLSSYSYSGHSRSEYAGHVYQSHGSWTSQSATVTGTLLGFAVGRMQGSFGEGRDKQMEFDRGSK